MPYYITQNNPDCPNWAVEKEDGELIGCHDSKESAIDQAVAISIDENTEFVGERAAVGSLAIDDYVSWAPLDPRIAAQIVMPCCRSEMPFLKLETTIIYMTI